jgi:hypothetical protein
MPLFLAGSAEPVFLKKQLRALRGFVRRGAQP